MWKVIYETKVLLGFIIKIGLNDEKRWRHKVLQDVTLDEREKVIVTNV